MLFDPAFFLDGGGFQVNPDGFEAGEFFQGFDILLEQPAIGKRKDIEHGSLP
jgi:hypothetical protein